MFISSFFKVIFLSQGWVCWWNLHSWKRDRESATELSDPGMCCSKSVKLCRAAVRKSVRMSCINAVFFCGTCLPDVHNCVVVAVDQEPHPSPLGSPHCGCYKNSKELLPLDVTCRLVSGPGGMQPVALPVTAVAKLAGVGVQLEGR